MKKLNILIPSLIGMFLLISLQSCTDHFEELNTNPSSVSSDVVNPGFLFTQSQREAVYDIPGEGSLKYFSGIEYSPSSGNIFYDSGYSYPYYTDELIAISDMIRLTDGDEVDLNRNAMGRIWKAWLFQNITDRFGDIPYFEAVLDQNETVSHPAYDSQREIYVDLMAQLKQAAEDLEVSDDRTTLGSQDLMYGGDVDSWIKFANSLRLRYALRVRFADADLAQEQIDDVIDEPMIENNDENALIMTKGEETPHTSNRHPMFNTWFNGPGNPASCAHPVVSNMQAAGSPHGDLDIDDPRLSIYCDPARTDGGYRGRTINPADGYDWYLQNRNVSLVGERFTEQSAQPIVVIDYAEVQFNIAEARLAGMANGDPQSAYQEGIRASMEFYEVEEPEISDFLNSTAGTLSGSDEDQLRMISTQRYISLFQQTQEAWTEWRRTGYPIQYVEETQPGHTSGEVPRRFTYPDVELSANQESVQQAIANLDGGDDLMSRIWWDARDGLPFDHPHADLSYPPPPDEDMTQAEVEDMIIDLELEDDDE
ncbi:MAG: SusD/RagB family nutrient-binding outer membrane lipoprotein [Balneolales bacterium]